jgi:hypothetical protein
MQRGNEQEPDCQCSSIALLLVVVLVLDLLRLHSCLLVWAHASSVGRPGSPGSDGASPYLLKRRSMAIFVVAARSAYRVKPDETSPA